MRKRLFIASLVSTLVACGDNITPPQPSPDGEPCAEDSECESGLCVRQFGDGKEIAGGMCSQECVYEQGTDSCPEGEACLRYTATREQFCFTECVSDEDCRVDEGWTCVNLYVLRACIPPL